LDLGHFAVGSFGKFSSNSKNKLLENANESYEWVRFERLFGTSILGHWAKLVVSTMNDELAHYLYVQLSTALGITELKR